MRQHLLFLLLLVLLPFGLKSQDFEAGLFGGGSYYLGDLNPGLHFLQTKPAFGALIKYNYTTRWAFRGGVTMGTVMASDARTGDNPARNLNFSSRITDISLMVEFNFFDYFKSMKRNIISPYIFGGVGIFFFNPKSGGVALVDIGTEGQKVGYEGREPYKLFSFALPFGVGVKYNISKRLSLAFEWGMRKTITDYIDDVSTTYYLEGTQIDQSNVDQMLSDPTRSHRPLMERGDPKTNDWYNFTGLYITYSFDPFLTKRCLDQPYSRMK